MKMEEAPFCMAEVVAYHQDCWGPDAVLPTAPALVMAGHSRPKDGVLSHACVPAIHVFIPCKAPKTWMSRPSPRMTERRCARSVLHPFVPAQAGTQACLISDAALFAGSPLARG